MPHRWKEGTDIYPHIHFMCTSDVDPSDNFGIEFEYTWCDIDEDFAKMLGLDSVESIRSRIKEKLAEEYEAEALSRMKRGVLSTVVTESTFEVPDGLVDRALESMMKSYREEFERSGDTDAEEKLREIEAKIPNFRSPLWSNGMRSISTLPAK